MNVTATAAKTWFLDSLATVHLRGLATDAGFSLVEMNAPAGSQPPLHVHHEDDEGFFVLEGVIRLWAGRERTTLSEGEFALAPKGVPHTYRVISREGARMLVTSSDGSFDRFVEAYGEPALEPRLPDPAEPDSERLAELAAEHGIEILGPPGTLPC